MKDKVIEYFKECGNLELIGSKNEDKNKSNVYSYHFDLKHIVGKEVYEKLEKSDSLPFVISDSGEVVRMLTFGLGEPNDSIDAQLLKINYVNKRIRYGKFIIDDSNDIYWDCSVDKSTINKKMILSIMEDYFYGFLVFCGVLDMNVEDKDE